MTLEDAKDSVSHRWKTWTTAIVASIAICVYVVTWADDRYVNEEQLDAVQGDLRFLTRLMLEERIVALDNRIQALESYPDHSPEDRNRLNELRLERSQMQRRLTKLNERGS